MVGGLEGWRRTIGVLRAELAAAPLLAWLHPEDAPALAALMDAPGSAEARLGHYDHRVRCRVELSEWVHGRAAIEVTRLEELPLSAWWLDAHRYAGSPALPSTLLA